MVVYVSQGVNCSLTVLIIIVAFDQTSAIPLVLLRNHVHREEQDNSHLLYQPIHRPVLRYASTLRTRTFNTWHQSRTSARVSSGLPVSPAKGNNRLSRFRQEQYDRLVERVLHRAHDAPLRAWSEFRIIGSERSHRPETGTLHSCAGVQEGSRA